MKKYIAAFFLLFSNIGITLNISGLPIELQLLILTKADLPDIFSYCETSTTTQQLGAQHQDFWKLLIERDFGVAPSGNEFWKEVYINLYEESRKALSAGSNHACAINSDGLARCWGLNTSGQASVPPVLGQVRAISAGFGYSCAIKGDGLVQCWGANNIGQSSIPRDLNTVKTIVPTFSASKIVEMLYNIFQF